VIKTVGVLRLLGTVVRGGPLHPSIGLIGVFADVVILLVLAAAVASPRVSQLARPLIATFAFALAWLAAAVLDALRAPGWTMILGGAVIVLAIAVTTATVHVWTLGGDDGAGEPVHRGAHDGGGPGRRPPDVPQHGSGGGAPGWWPEFECQFGSYVAEREREQRQSAVVPVEPVGACAPSDRRIEQSRGSFSDPSNPDQ
jgi:hypothetical protein